MKVEIEIKDEDIVDALVGAFEGGSNYWYNLPDASMVKRIEGKCISECITLSALYYGVAIPVYDVEEYEEEEGDSFLGYINKENIERGIKLYMDEYGTIKPEEMDAGDSDTLLQLIVMGEVVYG